MPAATLDGSQATEWSCSELAAERQDADHIPEQQDLHRGEPWEPLILLHPENQGQRDKATPRGLDCTSHPQQAPPVLKDNGGSNKRGQEIASTSHLAARCIPAAPRSEASHSDQLKGTRPGEAVGTNTMLSH